MLLCFLFILGRFSLGMKEKAIIIIKRMKNQSLVFGIVLSIIIINIVSIQPTETDSEPLVTLVFKTNGPISDTPTVRPDFGYMLKQYLARIGIDLDIIIQDWPTFFSELKVYRDFDICYVGLSGGGNDPDFTGIYSQYGSLNIFGYDVSMDWDDELGTGRNEWFMDYGNQIMPPNSDERIQHYWEWEQYLMDKICPLLPVITTKSYYAQWKELVGYNCSKGVFQSWGNMFWSDSHTGQRSTNELVLSDKAWSDLNPIFQDDTASTLITNACLDPLLWFDSDGSVWPHLAKNFTFIDDTTIKITVRDGIKWENDPDGNFTDEYLDIRDVYFTIYMRLHVLGDTHPYSWIEDMEIINDYTMKIYIDSDYNTVEKEPYAPCLESLALRILPEHYLNQSQLSDGVTPDILDDAWYTFVTHCFGTGLFQMDSFSAEEETILKVRPNSWWLDESITADSDLDWDRRFGDFTNYMDQLRIRIIPFDELVKSEFLAGHIDLKEIDNSPTVLNEFLSKPEFTIQDEVRYNIEFYGFNMREDRTEIGNRESCLEDESLTKGLALRKAICYAVNQDELNSLIYGGSCDVVYWPIYSRLGIWCNPNIIKYDYDVEKAKEYMAMIYGQIYGQTTNFTGFATTITISSIVLVAIVAIIYHQKKNMKINAG